MDLFPGDPVCPQERPSESHVIRKFSEGSASVLSFPSSDTSSSSSSGRREEDAWGEVACNGGSTTILVLSTSAVCLALLAGHAPGAEHPLFFVCDGVAFLAFVGYAGLRCTGRIGPRSERQVCAFLTWLLSLLINLGVPSRRRHLLGLEEPMMGEIEACEEGTSALWIALLLSTAAVVLESGPPGCLGLLGLVLSFQHLAIGVLLPRPECDAGRVPPGGPAGPLLGLPPTWISTLQLLALVALLTTTQWRLHKERCAEKLVIRYVEDHGSCFRFSAADADSFTQNQLERVTQEIENQECACADLLHELGSILPRTTHAGHAWAALVHHLAHILKRCIKQLKCRVEGDELSIKAMEAACLEQGPCTAQMVSGWLECDGTTTSIAKSEERHARDTCKKAVLKRAAHYSTNPAQEVDFRVGHYDFDALKVERERHNVLQLVGFELLQAFKILQKPVLFSFLEALERGYEKESPYHSHIHGADQCNTFYVLVVKSDLWQLLTDATCTAIIIAALGHDVGHFARNNPFLIATHHALAIRYNDRSILENHHAAMVSQLLNEEHGVRDNRGKLLADLPPEQVAKARHLIIALILGTDAQKHLEDLANFRVRLGASSYDPRWNSNDQQQALVMLFRAADIGHSAKSWNLHEEWSRRVVQEFHEQGDEELRLGLPVSPLCSREGFDLAASQAGFLQFICLPTWREVVHLDHLVRRLNAKGTHHTTQKNPRVTEHDTRGRKTSTASINSDEHLRDCAKKHDLLQRSLTGSNLGSHSSRGHITLKPLRFSPTHKVQPAATATAHEGHETQPMSPKSWLADVCLTYCEKNRAAWKDRAEPRSGGTPVVAGQRSSSRSLSPKRPCHEAGAA